jgi:hypothetical protein
MYTGTLIEDLIATVQRVEVQLLADRETAELERLYLASGPEISRRDHNLLGVA